MASNFVFKGKINAKGLEAIQADLSKIVDCVTQSDANQLGKIVIREMKDLIARGVSTVRGGDFGTKMPSYKNPKRYPGKKKSHTPVNLKLSGDFLDDLDYSVEKAKYGFKAVVGYSSQKQQLKELGHREGVNGQPKRPTIPLPRLGEKFAVSIKNEYLKVFDTAIKRISKKYNP